MRCLHHLRAASGERSNLHVGLAATTPLSEEETYRKVCRMGRDAPFLSEDEQRSSPPGSHPWPSFLTRAYGTLPTSLFFSSPNASMLAHVALPSCQPEGGYWASGERSSFHGTGAVWKEQRVWWGGFCLVISIVIGLYSYMFIYLYRYCVVFLLLYCMLTALGYYFLYIYILFLFLTSTSIFSKCRNYADRYTLLCYRQKTAFDLWYIPYQQTD